VPVVWVAVVAAWVEVSEAAWAVARASVHPEAWAPPATTNNKRIMKLVDDTNFDKGRKA